MKLLSHLIIFALGAVAGIIFGINHPQAAQNIDLKIQAETAKAKIVLLQELNKDHPSPDLDKRLADEQKNLDTANKQLATNQ